MQFMKINLYVLKGTFCDIVFIVLFMINTHNVLRTYPYRELTSVFYNPYRLSFLCIFFAYNEDFVAEAWTKRDHRAFKRSYNQERKKSKKE